MALDFPANPNENQRFTGPSNNIIYIYKGGKWTSIGAAVTVNPDFEVPVCTVGPNNPPDPAQGELWYNTNVGVLFVWYIDEDQSGVEGQWVDTRPPTAPAS